MEASIEALAPYAVPLILLTLGAVGWFVRRSITSAGRAEKLDLAAKLLDVRAKLRAPDLTTGQIDDILATAGVDRSMLPHFEHRSVESIERENENEPSVLSTTAAMGVRLDAQLTVLEAKIEQLMVDIEILAYHNAADNELGVENGEADHVRKMYRAWLRYRKSAAQSVMEDYRGGTIAGAMYLAEEIRISEAFLADLEERLTSLKL